MGLLLASIIAGTTAWARGLPAATKPKPVCPLEENCDCPVPGVTTRWVAAYCMAIHETDDEIVIADCLSKNLPEPPKGKACDANLHWKQKICEQVRKADVAACVSDPSFLPYPVPHGVGGQD